MEDGRSHMLDVFSTSTSLFKHVSDCGVIRRGVASDHTTVQMKININTITIQMKDTVNARSTDWAAITSDNTLNQIFNHNVAQQLQGKETYNEFFSIVTNVARATATTLPTSPVDWFEFSKSVPEAA